jgi:hypothetical protein
MMRKVKLVLCLIPGMLAAAALSSAAVQFQSAERQAALLEVFTSEGCSSCPPAESWLSHLKEAPGLWKDFVPVAFHVDYWDYLGWRDRWASKEFSDRQRAYAQSWGSDSLYTPGFVLNGKEWRDWSGRSSVSARSGIKAGVLKVTSEDANHWQVSFAPAVSAATSYELHAALMVSGVGSDVKSGENAGRHLKHDFVALKLIQEGLTSQMDGFQGMFTLDLEPKVRKGQLALAVWVTRSGQLEPVQAVGGWLQEQIACRPSAPVQ